ncbi:uncharacterized protein LOC132624308 [Lycium barbarum]|uniref:uncharacterized protein LOC132624308 n=1 Tax=Lycium barbarum TaxID=112863 RepID=UPI00293ED6D2|nr:uncharacterized protein LOC132624308 [Lycium barbarum]
MRIIPLWVQFPGLPLQYWIEENIGQIGSLLGKPVCTDKLTAPSDRISYARVLIEIDVSQPLPLDLNIKNPTREVFEQAVEYEWMPKFCLECCRFRHYTGDCKDKVDTYQEPAKHKKRRKKKEKVKWKSKPQENQTMQQTSEMVDKGKRVAPEPTEASTMKALSDLEYVILASKNGNDTLRIKEVQEEQRVDIAHTTSSEAPDQVQIGAPQLSIKGITPTDNPPLK